MSDEMTCRALAQKVTDYLEGALADAEREAADAHLTECDGCRAYLAQMRLVVRVLGAAAADDAPDAQALARLNEAWLRER